MCERNVIAVREELNMHLVFFLPTADVTDGMRSHGNFTFTELLISPCPEKKKQREVANLRILTNNSLPMLMDPEHFPLFL